MKPKGSAYVPLGEGSGKKIVDYGQRWKIWLDTHNLSLYNTFKV